MIAIRVSALFLSIATFISSQSHPAAVDTANNPAVRPLVQEAKASANHVKNDFQRGLLLDEIGALQAKLREYDVAVATARAAYPHTLKTLTALGRRLADDPAALRRISLKLNSGESSTVFANVAWAQADKGNIEQALRTSKNVPAPEVRSDVLRRLASRQSAAGDDRGARRSMSEANIAYPAQKSSPDDEIELIANGQLSRGDNEAARKTIESISSPEMRAAALLSAAELLSKAGDQSTARSWLHDALRTLPKTPRADFVRYMSLPLQVEFGEIDSALHFADSQSGDMRTKAYGAVAVTCAERRDEQGLQVAVAKIKVPQTPPAREGDMGMFPAQLQLLNISAALLDHDELPAAANLLDYVQSNLDDISRLNLDREIQLQRVMILAQRGEFAPAMDLALKMPPDSVADIQRGTAFRAIAVLETKTRGTATTRSWATALRDPEDRAYALVGIAQANLGVADVKLPYNAINVH
jgi:tetratricopeptide (TPR) repeat protein